ncbi:hypothetical protein D3C73_1174310 [compost metagenome]
MNGSFGDRIGKRGAGTSSSGYAAEIDDGPLFVLFHVRRHGSRAQEHAFDIYIVQLIPYFFRCRFQIIHRDMPGDAGIIYEQINCSEGSGNPFNHLPHFCVPGHIRLYSYCTSALIYYPLNSFKRFGF